MGFCLFTFSDFTFELKGFHLVSVHSRRDRCYPPSANLVPRAFFLAWQRGKGPGNEVAHSNRPRKIFGLIVVVLEASLPGQIFVLRKSNLRGATISQWFLDRSSWYNASRLILTGRYDSKSEAYTIQKTITPSTLTVLSRIGLFKLADLGEGIGAPGSPYFG